MTVVKHPRLPGVSRDVTDPRRWVKAGWVREVPPVALTPRPSKREDQTEVESE